jgi:aspartate/methionine/tyrosine aminotransferase
VLDGFSKTYAMTGWRLGYGIFPTELTAGIARLMTNSNSCTAAFTQVAGVEALTGPQADVATMVDEFRQRRKLIVTGLNAIEGVSCRMPHGAFYVFPNITGTGLTSREVADLLLQEAGVAVLAGTAFGAYGEGYIRLSYANSTANLGRALERMKATLEAHRRTTTARQPEVAAASAEPAGGNGVRGRKKLATAPVTADAPRTRLRGSTRAGRVKD